MPQEFTPQCGLTFRPMEGSILDGGAQDQKVKAERTRTWVDPCKRDFSLQEHTQEDLALKACVNNRSLAWLTGLTVLVGLIIPAAAATPLRPRAHGSSGLSSKIIAVVPPETTLDCDDESGDTDDPEVDDRQTNLSGEAETYTCAVTAQDGADEGTERDPVPDVSVDSEHQRANDPDNKGFGNANNPTADYDDACTTDVDGTCTFVLDDAPEAEVGPAFVCFWVDDDADSQYQDSVDPFDGGDCDNNENTTEAEKNDVTDKVNKTWEAVDPVECDDAVDNDGDGRTDFGDDPGCDSPEDDDESDGCDINGTSEADELVGTEAGEIICGRGGGDTIRGNGGADTIGGGLGADTIGGGRGGDTIGGGSGRDTIGGGRGPDRIAGGPGNDILGGGEGRDSISGNAGNDSLDGGTGTDSCNGGPGKNSRRRCE